MDDCLVAVLIYISLMTNDVEHLFICIWPSAYLLWRNVYSDYLLVFSYLSFS